MISLPRSASSTAMTKLLAPRSITCLTLALAVLLPCAAPAQQAPPSGGQLLQQLQPQPQPAPGGQPSVTLPEPRATASDDTVPFAVRRIELSGNTVFTTATLHALVAGGEGTTLTLARLQALAQRITDYYRVHGYPLARAIVPAQTLSEGVVHLRVIEARYGEVKLDNHSRVRDGLLQATLAPLTTGAPVDEGTLDRRLLLLDQLPGVTSHATLSPGFAVGTSDLTVQTTPTPLITGDASVDDAGNAYTGRARVGANLAVNSALGLGDQLSLSAVTSGSDMDYGRLAYELAVNGAGTRVGAGYSALRYQLGHALADLQAHGTAGDGSLWLTQPLVLSPNASLSARLAFDDKHLHDEVDSSGLHNDRQIRDWSAGLSGARRDALGAGGITTLSAGVTRGNLSFDDAAAQAADAVTANTQGTFTRWDGSLTRLQALTTSTRLYLALSGQHSSRNLDSAEQFLLGGPDSVRGYAVSTLAGACGYLATVELRHDLPLPGGQWQGSVFADEGGITVNPQPWPGATGSNHGTLSSAGLGLDWSSPAHWAAKLQLATPVGATPEIAGERPSMEAWVQLSARF